MKKEIRARYDAVVDELKRLGYKRKLHCIIESKNEQEVWVLDNGAAVSCLLFPGNYSNKTSDDADRMRHLEILLSVIKNK